MKARISVTVDENLLVDAKNLLKGTGITMSGFINITLQGLVASSAKPLRVMYDDMGKSMVNEITKVREGKRKK